MAGAPNLADAQDHHGERFPGIEVLPVDAFPQGEHAVGADSTIAQVKASGVDGVIIGNAACGSCSTALARAAAKLKPCKSRRCCSGVPIFSAW